MRVRVRVVMVEQSTIASSRCGCLLDMRPSHWGPMGAHFVYEPGLPSTLPSCDPPCRGGWVGGWASGGVDHGQHTVTAI